VVVQPPGVAVVLEDLGKVRERLPRDHRVAIRGLLHRFEIGLETPDVGERLSLNQDPLVLAQALGDAAGLVHDRHRQGAALGVDRQGGEHQHRRVASKEHQLEEVVDRVADPRVLLATVLLGEPLPEVLSVEHRVEVVLEEVTLHVEHELLTPDGISCRLGLGGRFRGDVIGPARFR
jgi:hypothetical protein